MTPTDNLWDVGAGTGSVSVELALAAHAGQVYAVECDPKACALIQKNREKFAAYNLTVIEGKAPEALDALPTPDAKCFQRNGGDAQPRSWIFVQHGVYNSVHVALCTADEYSIRCRQCVQGWR